MVAEGRVPAGDSVEALKRIWMEGYEQGLRACGERFGYNNGSANAMHGRPNITARCTMPRGHGGEHDRPLRAPSDPVGGGERNGD